MQRPDIDSIREAIRRCTCRKMEAPFCESFGCPEVQPLIDYIDHLERREQNGAMQYWWCNNCRAYAPITREAVEVEGKKGDLYIAVTIICEECGKRLFGYWKG